MISLCTHSLSLSIPLTNCTPSACWKRTNALRSQSRVHILYPSRFPFDFLLSADTGIVPRHEQQRQIIGLRGVTNETLHTLEQPIHKHGR